MFAARNAIFTNRAPSGPLYDSIGAAYLLTTPTTAAIDGTFADTAVSGAGVVVAVACVMNNGGSHTGFTRSATYNGAAMTSLGVVDGNNSTYGWLELFDLTNAGTGSSVTVEVKISNASGKTFEAVSAQAISYAPLSSAGTPVTAFGSTNSMASGTVSSTSSQRVLQTFAAFNAGISVTGITSSGNTRDTRIATATTGTGIGPCSAALVIADAPGSGSLSFTGSITSTTAAFWASIAVPLS